MSTHTFRNPHLRMIHPFRAWLRKIFPNASDGFVVGDVDLVCGQDGLGEHVLIRRYGENYKSDALGDLMITEIKENIGRITGGQRHIYSWLNEAIKTGKLSKRWRGCHLLHIEYKKDSPICPTCKQVFITEEEACQLFEQAILEWDDQEITHEELKYVLGEV